MHKTQIIQVAVGQPYQRLQLNARITVCRNPHKTYAKDIAQYEQSFRDHEDIETWRELYEGYDSLPEIHSGDIILNGHNDGTNHSAVAVRFGHINDRWKGTKSYVYDQLFYGRVELLDPLPETCIIENDHNPDNIISGFAKNDLRFSTTKTKGEVRITVNVRLNDECKNGHQDFSITGDGYDLAKNNHWRGCCHEEILKLWPQFLPFVNLHLSDRKGTPMYAIENGFYWLKEYLDKGKSTRVFQNQMRLTDDEVKHFELCDDKEYFHYLLYHLGVVARWEEEARQAIVFLEKMIGNGTVFLDDSVKENIRPLPPAKIKEIEERIQVGYYTPGKIEERRLAVIASKKQERIQKLRMYANDRIRKECDELQVHLYILNSGLSDENFIYYDHSRKGVFNWQDSSYHSKITKEQFNQFCSGIDYSKLPEGIEFQLKSA